LDEARTAYEALLGVEPDSSRVLNNLGVIEVSAGRPERAIEWYQRGFNFRPDLANLAFNMVATNLALGRVDSARAARARFAALRPEHGQVLYTKWLIAWAVPEYDSAAAASEAVARVAGATIQGLATNMQLAIAGVRGQPSRMQSVLATAEQRAAEGGRVPEHLAAIAWVATYEAVVQERPGDGLSRVERALARFPLDSMQPLDRPYVELAQFYARAEKPARARELLAAYRREAPERLQVDERAALGLATAYTSLAEGKAQEAIREFQAADTGQCRACALPGLARAFQAAGNPDSAAAVLERYLAVPDDDRALVDPLERAGALARLGELYEQRGDTANAVKRNAEFLALWKDADPGFKPALDRVRERQRRLTAER
jgi:tetratricopeptide (TPR) repeat protein